MVCSACCCMSLISHYAYIYINIVSALFGGGGGGNFYSDSSPAFKTAHKKTCLFIYELIF